MNRVARQPVWWIILTMIYFPYNAMAYLFDVPQISSPFQLLGMPLDLAVVLGGTAFAFGFRFGGFRLWAAIAILYAANTGPYLAGIVFRLARFTVNPDYHVYRSTSSYLVTIFLVMFECVSLIRILQSFRDEKRLVETFA